MTPTNTTALSLGIAMTLESMIRHLDQAFQQELIRSEELPMHFQQARYAYSMYVLNRRNVVRGLTEDLQKTNSIDLENLN